MFSPKISETIFAIDYYYLVIKAMQFFVGSTHVTHVLKLLYYVLTQNKFARSLISADDREFLQFLMFCVTRF